MHIYDTFYEIFIRLVYDIFVFRISRQDRYLIRILAQKEQFFFGAGLRKYLLLSCGLLSCGVHFS